MKKLIIGLVAALLSFSVHADNYDPATNQLTIPSITVECVTYTDVVITVGNIISIGGSSDQNNTSNERTCSWIVDSYSDSDKIKYELSPLPSHGAIRVALTG